MSITIHHLLPDGAIADDVRAEQLPEILDGGPGLVWVDLSDAGEAEQWLLEDVFGFHPVAVDTCLEPRTHPAKMERFDSYMFLLLHGVDHAEAVDVVATAELAMFIGPNYVVSTHRGRLFAVEAVLQSLRENPSAIAIRADFLAHALTDALVSNILPMVDALRDVAEELEEAIITNPRPMQLEGLIRLKRSTLRLARIVSPQVAVLGRLGRGEQDVIGPGANVFFADAQDQLVFTQGLIESTRERADSAVATYMSSVAVQQNEAMRMLAVVAAIFLPLTLIAGIYGMNFENMPELEVSWAYFAVLAFMAAVVALGTLWLTWRRWLGLGRRAAGRVRPFMVERQRVAGAMRPLKLGRYVAHMRRPQRFERR